MKIKFCFSNSFQVETCIPWSESSTQQIDLGFNIFFLIYFFIRVFIYSFFNFNIFFL